MAKTKSDSEAVSYSLDVMRCAHLLQIYCSMLSAVDWARDMRKQRTICSDCLKMSRLALEVFESETKNGK